MNDPAKASGKASEKAPGRAAITIMVNGEPRPLSAGSRVGDLLAALALPAAKVAVELNREIVPRSRFAVQALADGDQVEIVHFVGGG